MTNFNGFRGKAKRIEDLDLPKIGNLIGVGEDEIHALIDVEAAGSGFDTAGRPKMLFEPHKFYRHLSGLKRDQAVREGLAYPKWKPGAYPKESYTRLAQAASIDETAALKSASWGAGQIMGENHLAAGYDTVQDMVLAFMDDEENHFRAMVEFIIANHLDDELRAHNWAAFARGYNGSGYKANKYDTKLAAAYAKWAKVKDTAWDPKAKPETAVKEEDKHIDVVAIDGPKKGETTIVATVENPKNPPAKPEVNVPPKTRNGMWALIALILPVFGALLSKCGG